MLNFGLEMLNFDVDMLICSSRLGGGAPLEASAGAQQLECPRGPGRELWPLGGLQGVPRRVPGHLQGTTGTSRAPQAPPGHYRAPGGRVKMLNFGLGMLSFGLEMLNFELEMLTFGLQMLNFGLQMLNFGLEMLI